MHAARHTILRLLHTFPHLLNENLLSPPLGKAAGAKRKKPKQQTLKQALTRALHYGPQLVEHALLRAGLEPAAKLAQVDASECAPKLAEAFEEVDGILATLATQENMPGYLVSVPALPSKKEAGGSGGGKVKLSKAERKAKRKAEEAAAKAQQEHQQGEDDQPAEEKQGKDAAASASPSEGQAAVKAGEQATKDDDNSKPEKEEEGEDQSEEPKQVMVHREFFPILLEQHKQKLGEYSKEGM